MHQGLRSPLPLDFQMRGRGQSQEILLFRWYDCINKGVTPVYIIYFMLMIMISSAMTYEGLKNKK